MKLPAKKNSNPNVTVPEDLVQVQAYMRWERKGKQNYTREQEKVYDLALFPYLGFNSTISSFILALFLCLRRGILIDGVSFPNKIVSLAFHL